MSNRSHYPHGFRQPPYIRSIPVLSKPYGNVFHVDSGHAQASDANPGTAALPLATIDGAVNKCTANNGDLILLAPGHSESITAAAGIDLDVAGITVRGEGVGSDMATVSMTTVDSVDIDVDAANITIENIYFDLTGVDSIDAPIDVNAAYFTARGCIFLMADSGGQADSCIVTDANADNMLIEDCVIRSPNAGAAEAIQLTGASDGVVIRNNDIRGDFSVAPIHNPTANVATNVTISQNYLQNDQTGDFALELVSAVTGVIADNLLVTDAIATALDAGACACFGNKYFDSSDTDADATAIPTTPTAGGEGTTTIGGIDDATTDSIHGKIGTDTEMADNSLYDLIGADAKTDALAAALYGTAGIATFPSPAAAANAVSMAEVLRYISDLQVPKVVVKESGDLTSFGTSKNLFTVTGDILARCAASVDVAVTSTSGTTTLEVGVAGATACLLVQDAADNTAFDVGDSWTLNTAPDTNGAALTTDWVVIGNGATIILTGSVDDITAGEVDFYLQYIPLTTNGAVAAA